MSSFDTMTSPRLVRPLTVDGIAHFVLQVGDMAVAKEFYRDLGFRDGGSDVLPQCGAHSAMRAASGQILALVQVADAPDLRDTGVHQAYRVSAAERTAIGARLAAKGATVFSYKEDRPAEEADNFYVFDPTGNRVQLVAPAGAKGAGILGLDHAAVQTADMLWAEKFYGEQLGLAEDYRMGWQTADYVRARKWAAGEEDMAPGARRLDQRYTVMVNRKTVPRCNMQLYFRAGDGVLGVYLANKHFQESPEELAIGTPRIAFTAARAELDRMAPLIAATGKTCEGPVIHPQGSPLEASFYFRDGSGNFFELCTPRKR